MKKENILEKNDLKPILNFINNEFIISDKKSDAVINIKALVKYLSENDIKQSYICLVTDIEKNKLSRILNGSQNITEEDMNKMSKAVGKNISYFLREDFMPEKIIVDYNSISLCADKIDKEQLQTVDKIRSLLISADIVLGSEDRFMGIKL